ncbi:hypothetical protein PANA5342_pPANA10250 (plasmid) [Pantoea ananatis LMG 5342]|nr:hypothetical protein PANA5342_pPANA10250 [Pantoea ananatis LMG 5342]
MQQNRMQHRLVNQDVQRHLWARQVVRMPFSAFIRCQEQEEKLGRDGGLVRQGRISPHD